MPEDGVLLVFFYKLSGNPVFCLMYGLCCKNGCVAKTGGGFPAANIGQVRIGLDSLLSRRAAPGRPSQGRPIC